MSEVKAVLGRYFDNQTPNLSVLTRMEMWNFSVVGDGEVGIVFTFGC